MPPWITLHAHPTLASTSDEAQRLAAAGAADGTVVWALEQQAGRGRLGRSWASPPGNLYASIVLRRGGSPAELGFACALAMADLADSALPPGLRARLKWPNDVLLGGAKLAGVLVEASEGCVVAGMGVNLLHAPDGLPYSATSLAAHAAPLAPREALTRLLHALDARLAQRAIGFAHTRTAWLARGPAIGAPVTLTLQGKRVSGTFEGLDEDGALLAMVGGERRRVVAGEVGFG